jgi:hypothetical protein
MLAVGDFVKVHRVVLDEQTTPGTRLLLAYSLGRLGYVVSIAASQRNPVMVEFSDRECPCTMTFMYCELVKVLPIQIGAKNGNQESLSL